MCLSLFLTLRSDGGLAVAEQRSKGWIPWLVGGVAAILGLAAWSSQAGNAATTGKIEEKSESPSGSCAPITARAFYLGLVIVGAFESAINWGLLSAFRLNSGRYEIAFGMWQANADAGTLGLLLQKYKDLGGTIDFSAYGDPKLWGSRIDAREIETVKGIFAQAGNDLTMRRAQVILFMEMYFLPACSLLQVFNGSQPASFAALASACVQLGTARTEQFLRQAIESAKSSGNAQLPLETLIMLNFCDLYIGWMQGIQSRGAYGFDLTDRPKILRYLVETDPQLQNDHTIHGVAIQRVTL